MGLVQNGSPHRIPDRQVIIQVRPPAPSFVGPSVIALRKLEMLSFSSTLQK